MGTGLGLTVAVVTHAGGGQAGDGIDGGADAQVAYGEIGDGAVVGGGEQVTEV